ncbi:T9SS type A sorting domain-containing protein [uncultured Dokdonia sp.]|uniref:T9SS type A sorting domain-containing protein n=1 Tax=uncultured Dokdonia sp. TaxID=575653 RepID=UPI00261F21D1|nr:T9SS type A sorting domain-containing protein [uncultured Dokdonia sp.]
MKKITLFFLLAFLGGITMQAQNLLTNGDFEEGMTVWEGNGFNVQTDGGNSFNFVDVASAGEPFAVNLSQRGINIAQGQTFTLTFDASTDAATGSRTMIAGIGLFVDPFTNQSMEVTVTDVTQSFSLELVANFSSTDSRVLFDMGAATGVVVIDNVTLTLNENTGGDELLENGDFEQGMVVWEGNGFNVQTDGGNSFNFVDVASAGEPFAVNLSQRGINIAEGQTFTLTFDASTDATTGSRTMIAGIGLFVDPFTNQSMEVTVTDVTQTFSLELVANFSSTDSRVLFDMGAATGVVVIDNVSLVQGNGNTDPVLPAVAAPTPPERDPNTVFSLFSDAYTQQPNTVFGAFGVGTQDITTIQIEGDNTQQLVLNQPASEFLLVDWGEPLDLSALTHFHMDYWIDTSLSTGLIANPKWSNHVGDGGETSFFQLTNPVVTFGEWVSIDVPLTVFVDGDATQQRDALRQFVLTLAGAEPGTRTIFIDNLYLHNNTTLSTEEFTSLDVSVYPNPSTDRWTVSTSSDSITSVAVYDLLGRRVALATPNATTFDINASNLRTGIYLATITTNQGQETIKLIKR